VNVSARETGLGRVAKLSVEGDDGTVRWRLDGVDRENLADIGPARVVGQDIDERSRPLFGRDRVGAGDGRVIGGANRQTHRGDVGAALAIGGGVAELVRAMVVVGRDVQELRAPRG
jgi:hypothetical protein